MNVARIIPLSKDEESPLYPKKGKVRTIAILPSISKLYEAMILQRLEKHVKDHKILHPNQRGFSYGHSCDDNLIDLFNIIDRMK